MKKNRPKLSLRRETIRDLTMDALGKAAGGHTDITCNPTCTSATMPNSRCIACTDRACELTNAETCSVLYCV